VETIVDRAAPHTRSVRGRKLTLSAIILALLTAVAAVGSWAAWTVSDSNSGNSFSTNTVLLDDNQGGLCFVVRDTGPGIDPKDCERIFAPFCQLDGSATRHHPGIGLGLALSRKLAGLLGGSITVEARPGHGSTFRFALPLGVGAVGAKAKAA